MLKQLKRARDRFFGIGEADTSVPVLDGPLKPNHLLEEAAVFFETDHLEDLCVTADDQLVVASGASMLVLDEAGKAQAIATLDQPIQALAVCRNGLVAATSNTLHFIGGSLGGKQYRLPDASFVGCINAVCEHPDGSIVVSEGSSRHEYGQWSRDLLSDGNSGRVLQYFPERNELKVLRQGLRFAYGVLVDSRGAIFTSESWAHRIVEVGQAGVRGVYQDLPGYPARLTRARAGGYWLAVFAPRNQLVEFVLRETGFKKAMMEQVEPNYWIAPALHSGNDFFEPMQQGGVRQMGILKPWAPARSYGLVVRLDADFQPQYSLHSRVGGLHHGVTAVTEYRGMLLVLSKGAGRVLHLPLSDVQ
ncbi:strictosidine synthase [Ottowia sp.]|uniref:strictosidine synthase n=1 Tax=Ottowia sp. TaxID=1898956 RepID=UPI00395E1EAE